MMAALWWLCGLLVLVSLAQADRGDVRYTITVITGRKKNSGTDSTVVLGLYGTLRNVTGIRLENCANHHDKFEFGQTDTFSAALPDLGTITLMSLTMYPKGVSPGWYARRVKVTDPDTPTKHTAGHFDRWYGPDESQTQNDKKTRRSKYL